MEKELVVVIAVNAKGAISNRKGLSYGDSLFYVYENSRAKFTNLSHTKH